MYVTLMYIHTERIKIHIIAVLQVTIEVKEENIRTYMYQYSFLLFAHHRVYSFKVAFTLFGESMHLITN